MTPRPEDLGTPDDGAPVYPVTPRRQPWLHARVCIATHRGARDVAGYVSASVVGLAVTWTGCAWTLTHTATGRALAAYGTRGEAQKAAEALPALDWTADTLEGLTDAHRLAAGLARTMPGNIEPIGGWHV